MLRGERVHEVPAPRRHRRPPLLRQQRAPGRDRRRHRRPAAPLRRCRCAPRSAPTCSASGCGCRRRSPPSWPATRRRSTGSAATLRAAAARGRHRQRLPLPRLPRPGRQAAPSTARTGRAGPPRLHPRLRAGAGRAAARRRRARQHLDAPAGLAHPWYADRDRAAARAARAAGRRPGEVDADAGRPVRVGFEPEPGCVVETVADAVERLAWLRESTPTSSASASTPATSPPAFEDTAEALDRLAAAGLPVVKIQASAALHADDPADRRHAAALAGYAEDRFLHQTREPRRVPRHRRATTSTRRSAGRPAAAGPAPVAGALPRAAARRPRAAADQHPRPPRGQRSPRWSAATAPVTDHVEVETYTWGVLPPHLRPARRRRAGRRHRRRGRAGCATGSSSWASSACMERGMNAPKATAAGRRRRRADPRAAGAHAARARRGGRPASPPSWARCCRRSPARCSRPSSPGCCRRARHRRQRLVLPRPRRGAPLAPAQRAGAGREAVGRRPPQRPGYKVANVCWWYAMGADVDSTVTPRPVYHADGRKSPDCWTWPPELHDRLTDELGAVPAVHLLGPDGGDPQLALDRRGRARADARARPDPGLRAAPRLRPAAVRPRQRRRPWPAARDVDAVLAPLLDDAERTRRHRRAAQRVRHHQGHPAGRRQPAAAPRGPAARAPQRHRRAARPVDVAGLRGRRPPGRPRLRQGPRRRARACADLLRGLDGVDEVLDREGQAAYGLDHERAGELVLVAEPDAWFTYYYWLDDANAPDFAKAVEIHKKPGYDPAELFLDPEDQLGQGCAPRLGAGPKEGRAALRDERGAARPGAGQRQPRPAAGAARGGPGARLLRPGGQGATGSRRPTSATCSCACATRP